MFREFISSWMQKEKGEAHKKSKRGERTGRRKRKMEKEKEKQTTGGMATQTLPWEEAVLTELFGLFQASGLWL